jgi:uncharacterized protein YciI
MAVRDILQFIYHFDPIRSELVTDPDAWTEEDLRVGEAHFAYLKGATEDGIVLLAGRSLDGVGPANVIFKAETEETAHEFMQNGPFVTGGLMQASLHPIRAALMRK